MELGLHFLLSFPNSFQALKAGGRGGGRMTGPTCFGSANMTEQKVYIFHNLKMLFCGFISTLQYYSSFREKNVMFDLIFFLCIMHSKKLSCM